MRPPASAVVSAALTLWAALLIAGASPDAVADPWGTPLGRGPLTSTISSASDVDAFMVEGRAGGKLSLDVRAARRSDLVPDVRVLAPDGSELTMVAATNGRARLRGEPTLTTGRYVIEVRGAAASTGDFRVTARATGRRGTRRSRDVADVGAPYVIPFPAAGGARVSFRVSARSGVPLFSQLLDPLGRAVAVPEGVVSGNARAIGARGLQLPEDLPFGQYSLVFAAPGSRLSGLAVRVSVAGPRSAGVRGVLPDAEPTLLSVDPPEAGSGTQMTLTGTGLTPDGARDLRVFVAGVEVGAITTFGSTGLGFAFPVGLEGAVDVALLTPDGHAAVLESAVLAVPPPRIVTISPTRGPESGGTTLQVLGDGFRPTTAVTVAGAPLGGATTFISDSELRLTTQPFPPGPQTIGARDATGQSATATQPFHFVAAPRVNTLRPPLVPRLADTPLVLEGSALRDDLAVTVGATPATAISAPTSTRLDVTLPRLPRGAHTVRVEDEFGQAAALVAGVHAFDFESGPTLPGGTGLRADDIALGDYDRDGDQDIFVVTRGGEGFSEDSLLRVLRNDGDTFTDVTEDVIPDPTIDDWRGGALFVADVAGDSVTPPDGWPDLIIGSTDETVLPAGRSRLRVLANRSGGGGARYFSDRTTALIPAPLAPELWKVEDVWAGDLDGNAGVPDIVIVHDAVLIREGPLAPFPVDFLSGTRVFAFDEQQSAFVFESTRLPSLSGTRQMVPGTPHCPDDACADQFRTFRGTSLAVRDIDLDGLLDIAVTSPLPLTLDRVNSSSTQIGRNQPDQTRFVFVDHTTDLPSSSDSLSGDTVLLGDVSGGVGADLVVVSRAAAGQGAAMRVVENRGFGTPWTLKTTFAETSTGEQLAADAAEIADLDGDGALDIALLAAVRKTGQGGLTGRGLRMLRAHPVADNARDLESVLPGTPDEFPLVGSALAVGNLDRSSATPAGLSFVIIPAPGAPAEDTATIVRRAAAPE